MQNKCNWKISKNDKNVKLLSFLKEKLSLSNRDVKKILDKGLCYVNGKIERFSTVVLKEGSCVGIDLNWKKIASEKKSKIILDILYEDEYFLAVDKPVDFVCSDENINQFFMKHYTLIHRLDKDTTGVLLIAKNHNFKEEMIKLFKEKKVYKTYIARIDGSLKEDEMKIEGFLNKVSSIDGQTIYGHSSKGKYALTYLKVLKRYKDSTLVELTPITGRTHQLRVHMKHINHPILGDFLYSKKFVYEKYVPRLMLHCSKIEFIHPITSKDIIIFSEIPSSFEKN
ncbi:MAG: RluA family pseudouridine synthase [Parachlamydiales bacterium]|jgi:RluA family pseudouridine synthase